MLSQVALETTGRNPRPSNNQWVIPPGTVCSLDSGENTPTRTSEHGGNAPLRRPASGSTGQSPNRPRGLDTPHSNPRRRHVPEPQRLVAASMKEKTSKSRNAGGKPLDDKKPNPEEQEPGTRVKGRFVVIKAVSFPHDHIEIQATTTDLNFLDDLQTKYWARCSAFKTYFSIHRFHHWGFDRVSYQPVFLEHLA